MSGDLSKRALLALMTLLFLSGCVGLMTTNDKVNAANYAAAGLIEAKSIRGKQAQENFEQDLDRTMRPGR